MNETTLIGRTGEENELYLHRYTKREIKGDCIFSFFSFAVLGNELRDSCTLQENSLLFSVIFQL
jgi:hypothetical protein